MYFFEKLLNSIYYGDIERNQPDRRGFSIENAPETYATLEQLLLSLPLRHEDYGMDPSRGIFFIYFFRPENILLVFFFCF